MTSKSRAHSSEVENLNSFQQRSGLNNFKNPNSFDYFDVITHIPLQRSIKSFGYDYQCNQFIKHAIEDGHVNYNQLSNHTQKMESMNSKDAYEYALLNLNFNDESRKYCRH